MRLFLSLSHPHSLFPSASDSVCMKLMDRGSLGDIGSVGMYPSQLHISGPVT